MVHLREFGEGEEQCLWIHGLGESSLCFVRIVELLPGYRHLLVDLPGYGRAERVDEVYSLAQVADHLKDIGRSWLIGHSMGGVVGVMLCERYPEMVRGFINVDGNVSIGDCGYSGPITSSSLDSFLTNDYQVLLRELRDKGAVDLAHRGYARSFALAQPTVLHHHARELVELSKGEELGLRQSRLTVPHCYIAGQPDGAAARSLELIKEAEVPLHTVRPSGHWPFLDQPERFSEIVQLFIRGCDRL